jgi:hypothetical protein
VVGWRVAEELTLLDRVRQAASRYGTLAVLAVAVATVVGLALAVTDATPSIARFWREHQIWATFATEIVIIPITLVGLSAVLAARERRRWRPLGVWVVDVLHPVTQIGEILWPLVHNWARERYGESEPEGKDYDRDLIPEAFSDPDFWEPEGDDPETMLDEIRSVSTRAEAETAEWSAVLISEPGLANIAARMPDVLGRLRRLIRELEFAEYVAQSGDKKAREWREKQNPFYSAEACVSELRGLARSTDELLQLMLAYRDDRPIVPIYADEEAKDEKANGGSA